MFEITDEESAESWLKDRPREAQVAFAARCALRALPGIGVAKPDTLSDIALPVLRAMLISGVASTRATPEIREAANGATAAARAATSAYSATTAAAATATATTAATTATAATATTAAAAATTSARAATAAYSAAAATTAATTAATAAYSAASSDADRLQSYAPVDLFNVLLWHGEAAPDGLLEAWSLLEAFFNEAPGVWRFWQGWYEGMLKGRPLDWDLQEAVALIPEEDWEQGPEHIAAEIEKLRRDLETPDLDKELMTRQAERLVAQSGITVFLCRTTADEIDAAIRINCLPVAFETLRLIPPTLRLIAELAAARERIEELEKQNADLIASLERLTKALETAKGKSRSELFGDMVVETSAVVLTTGFWALIGATASHLTGIVDVGDLLDRFGQSVGELPLQGPGEGSGWPDPEIET